MIAYRYMMNSHHYLPPQPPTRTRTVTNDHYWWQQMGLEIRMYLELLGMLFSFCSFIVTNDSLQIHYGQPSLPIITTNHHPLPPQPPTRRGHHQDYHPPQPVQRAATGACYTTNDHYWRRWMGLEIRMYLELFGMFFLSVFFIVTNNSLQIYYEQLSLPTTTITDKDEDEHALETQMRLEPRYV